MIANWRSRELGTQRERFLSFDCQTGNYGTGDFGAAITIGASGQKEREGQVRRPRQQGCNRIPEYAHRIGSSIKKAKKFWVFGWRFWISRGAMLGSELPTGPREGATCDLRPPRGGWVIEPLLHGQCARGKSLLKEGQLVSACSGLTPLVRSIRIFIVRDRPLFGQVSTSVPRMEVTRK